MANFKVRFQAKYQGTQIRISFSTNSCRHDIDAVRAARRYAHDYKMTNFQVIWTKSI